MVHSTNGHRTRRVGKSGAPPDLKTTALAAHHTPAGPWRGPIRADITCLSVAQLWVFDHMQELEGVTNHRLLG